MKQLLLLSVASTVALAQAKPAPSPARDGGVPGPVLAGPNRPAPVQIGDGGVALPVATTPAPAAPNNAEVERLRKEVADLKLKVLEAEQRSQAKVDTLSTQLEKVSTQLEQLQGKIDKVSQAEERRAEAEQAEVTRRTSTAAASSNLNAVLTQLASGNTSGVEQSLRYAESVYSGNALKNVQAARAALSNGDVFAARELLIMAIIDADAQR